MQNIRVSIDLLKLGGARLVRFPNAANVPTDYVCVPVSVCFVPRDTPRPYLMASLIHCPNAKYGDFMVKPYVSADDYKVLSKEEQFNLPIIGKGTFMQEATNKQLAAAAESINPADISTAQTLTPTAANGSAASSEVAPPLAMGEQPLPITQQTDFEVYTPEGWVSGLPSFEAAQVYVAGKEVSFFIIREVSGPDVLRKWRWVNDAQCWELY